jgi:hypothetical protein
MSIEEHISLSAAIASLHLAFLMAELYT